MGKTEDEATGEEIISKTKEHWITIKKAESLRFGKTIRKVCDQVTDKVKAKPR